MSNPARSAICVAATNCAVTRSISARVMARGVWLALSQGRALAEISGQFPAGSMGPKIDAAMSYLQELPNANHEGEVIITSLEQAFEALMGRAGTHITMQTPKP